LKKRWLWAAIPACVLAVGLLIGAAYVYYTITHRAAGYTFDSNGVPIHYTDEGKGEPVLLLHGFAVQSDLNWRRPGIIDLLSKRFRVISMDLRGHGLSGKPHEGNAYGVEMSKDVVRLMDHLHIQKAHIVGYSLGGFVALKMAVLYPDRVITLSALGSGWERPDRSAFLAMLENFKKSLRAGKSVDPLIGGLGPGRKKPSIFNKWWINLMTSFFNDPLALAGMLDGLEQLALSEDEVKSLTMPSLGIVGTEDPLRIGAEALAKAAPDHTLIFVEGKDHLGTPFAEKTQRELYRFLMAHRSR